jgi:uncharacterized small protein (DUF1192 family)
MPLLRCICLFLCVYQPFAIAKAPPPEIERIEKTLQALTELKTKVSAIEHEVDQLIAELSEEKGAAANAKPAPFGGISSSYVDSADPAKPKPVRCAALTAKGERCSRAAVPGSRYCRQHQTAHQ